MVVCEGLSCLSNCPGWIYILISFGVLTIYSLIAWGIYTIAKSINEDVLDNENLLLISIFWIATIPVAIIASFVYWLVRIVALPFVAATKEDLARTEERITNRMIRTSGLNSNTTQQIGNKKFKVGDMIAGISGNPDGYKHLNEGSISRVVRYLNDKGQMEVVLVNHKDFEQHKDVIGKIFKAPDRNFVLIATKKTRKTRTKRRH